MITPAPGIYTGVPMADYHAWTPAASNSRLSKLRRSPAHLKAYMDAPSEDTTALRIGHASHSAILEPDLFATSFTMAEQCAATKKGDGNRCNNAGIAFHPELGWLCGVHTKGIPGEFDTSRIVLPENEYATSLAVRRAVLAHPKAKALLSGPGEAELSLVWNDPANDVACKARFDRYSPEIAGGAIVDIKTTKDASPREFERAIFSLGYHRQGAFYLQGAKANGLAAEHFVIIAVEKEPPFAVAVYRLTEGAIDAGDEQLAPLLRTYGTCVALNDWPGYAEDVQDIALPAYAWGQIEEEVAAFAGAKP